MERQASAGAPWRESWSIALTVVSAVLLAVVLWQTVQLSKEQPLERDALAKEQAAVHQTDRVIPVIEAVDAYRYALILDTPDRARLAKAVREQFDDVAPDFTSGEGAILGMGKRWDALTKAWTQRALRVAPGPNAYMATSPYVAQLAQFMSDMQDASGLTYDPNIIAQNMANSFTQETPFALMASARLKTLVDRSAADRGMTLERRMIFNSAIGNARASADLSGDNPMLVTKLITQMVPARKDEWAHLVPLSIAMNDAGSALADLVQKHALLEMNGPSAPLPAFAAAAAKFDVATIAMHRAAGNVLAASLAHRGEILALRNRYLYIAFILGAVLLVSVPMWIMMMVARRDRAMLRDAQRESSRLGAELARQEAEQAARLSEAQFRAVFDGAAVGIAVVDRTGAVVDTNSVFRTMFGDSLAMALEGHDTDLTELFAGESETFEFEQHLRVPSGEIWTDVTVSVVNDENDQPLYAICMFRDKTALKHSERRMLYEKSHDALTGLPNRQLFEEQLRARFAEANALLDSFFAVLFIDLEHFKDVNESMGHAAGDLVLTQVAGRMRSAVDPRDVVARLGSDEFAVLIQSLGDILHVESVARRILNNLGKPVTIGQKTIYLSACIGVAIGSSNYEHAEDVMRDAEIAMQHAKSSGSLRYAVFDSKMHARAAKRLELTSDLRLGIERGDFKVLYQPIVSLADGMPVGCEALIRWEHPTEGLINPSDFIPLAEQTGLASAIGRFVLQSAAEQLAAWRRNRGGLLEFRMNVNISAGELNDPDFERALVQVIEHNGLSPSDITLEITENVVLDPTSRANVTLERVRGRGFRICIDDFGTGYSSLRYLQQFKVDAIKIDRSFVSGSDGELASEPIVRTLMTLAEAYDVSVVAEGVETERQRELLRGAGCRLAQGFLFARPLSATDMVAVYPDVLGRINRSASA